MGIYPFTDGKVEDFDKVFKVLIDVRLSPLHVSDTTTMTYAV